MNIKDIQIGQTVYLERYRERGDAKDTNLISKQVVTKKGTKYFEVSGIANCYCSPIENRNYAIVKQKIGRWVMGFNVYLSEQDIK